MERERDRGRGSGSGSGRPNRGAVSRVPAWASALLFVLAADPLS